MPDLADSQHLQFLNFGLIVTGRAEEQFLPLLFRSISASGTCSFRVIRRIGQRSPIKSQKRRLQMMGSGKHIPDRDATDIGLPARQFLSSESSFVILIDDLEAKRSEEVQQVFDRYRLALNEMLERNQTRRASVHFLVNMLEACYFADAQAVNPVLGTEIRDYEGDVETIRNPKSNLKRLCQEFNEIAHGRRIVGGLRVSYVLSRKETCASLRTLFAWICKAIGEPAGETYQLLNGDYSDVTRHQVGALASRKPEE